MVGGGKRKAGGLEELDNPKNTKRAALGELTNNAGLYLPCEEHLCQNQG